MQFEKNQLPAWRAQKFDFSGGFSLAHDLQMLKCEPKLKIHPALHLFFGRAAYSIAMNFKHWRRLLTATKQHQPTTKKLCLHKHIKNPRGTAEVHTASVLRAKAADARDEARTALHPPIPAAAIASKTNRAVLKIKMTATAKAAADNRVLHKAPTGVITKAKAAIADQALSAKVPATGSAVIKAVLKIKAVKTKAVKIIVAKVKAAVPAARAAMATRIAAKNMAISPVTTAINPAVITAARKAVLPVPQIVIAMIVAALEATTILTVSADKAVLPHRVHRRGITIKIKIITRAVPVVLPRIKVATLKMKTAVVRAIPGPITAIRKVMNATASKAIMMIKMKIKALAAVHLRPAAVHGAMKAAAVTMMMTIIPIHEAIVNLNTLTLVGK